MDSLRINNIQHNNYTQNFQGRLKSLNDLNPISRYSDIYFRKSAGISRMNFLKIQPELEPHIKVVRMMSNKKVEISAWDINPTESKQYVLFLHGMAQNVTNYQNLYKNIINKDLGVFAVEYRNYGHNPKTNFSEDKLRHDAETAYKYLIEKKGINPEDIIILGHSMGGALATNLATHHPDTKSLILICPIVNIAKIGEKFATNKVVGEGIPARVKRFTEKLQPLNWLYSLRFNSLNKMRTNKVPTYIIQSQNDMVTPIGPARTLAKVSLRQGTLQEMFVLNSGGHIVDEQKVDTVAEILGKIATK